MIANCFCIIDLIEIIIWILPKPFTFGSYMTSCNRHSPWNLGEILFGIGTLAVPQNTRPHHPVIRLLGAPKIPKLIPSFVVLGSGFTTISVVRSAQYPSQPSPVASIKIGARNLLIFPCFTHGLYTKDFISLFPNHRQYDGEQIDPGFCHGLFPFADHPLLCNAHSASEPYLWF